MTDLAMLACASDDIPPWAAVAIIAIIAAAVCALVWMTR